MYRLQQGIRQTERPEMQNRKALFNFTSSTLTNGLRRNLAIKSTTAKTGGCVDTSSRFFLLQDSSNFYVKDYIRAKDGNLLLCGEFVKFTGTELISKGFLMKCDEKGNVYWTKLYDSLNHKEYSYLNYYRILELKDGSILLSGSTPNRVTDNDDLLITKTDPAGDILWSKVFKSRLWGHGNGSTDYYYVQHVKQDNETGNIYLTGPHWTEGRSIINLNSQNGSIVWSNLYQPFFGGYFDTPFGLDIRGDELLVFGRFLTNYKSYLSIYRINKVTGDTIQSKFFSIADNINGRFGFLNIEPLSKLENGNYIIKGSHYGYYRNPYDPGDTAALYHAGYVQFGTNLNFVNAYSFRNNTESNNSNTKLSVFPDGSGLFTMLQYVSGYKAKVFYTQFKNNKILSQRIRYYDGEGIPIENSSLQLTDGGSLTVKLLGDSATNSAKVEFLKLHITDTSSQCLGIEDHSTFMQPFSLKNEPGYIDSIGKNVFQENPNKTITTENTLLNYLPGCEQVSFCDSFSLSSSAKSICVSDPLLITVHKNPECRAPVFFNFDSSHLQSREQVNDSVYSLLFASSWKGVIHGYTYGCNLLADSVEITVLNSPPLLNLGPDTVLCPGNTITLNAGNDYATYLWQDGSSDSFFIVNKPGKYFTKTTNACGGVFNDTVIVSAHPPIPFDAGPDLSKCNNDSLIITMPSGFISYLWTPANDIRSDTSRSVAVNPHVTTTYKIRAEKSPGCFAYDSLKVTVYTSPVIDMGSDRSFCFGDSILLDAGVGFSQYQWNKGNNTQKIIAKNTGEYSVIATTAEGCQSFDTLKVINVFENPVVALNKDTALCAGTVRELDAGNFNSYLWNNGERTRTILASETGIYYVTVTDLHSCIGTDTLQITTLLPLPGKFLPADTSICSYSKIELSPVNNFSKYLWNNHADTKIITISEAGTYWLQVTDNNNCTGRDSIIINPKDCMAGFYIPNAFTPDNDGKNDDFKPLLFGVVVRYEFMIYNRFGENVFKTNNLKDGWDGKYKSMPQESDIFIWICKYQFSGETEKVEKGTVMIVK